MKLRLQHHWTFRLVDWTFISWSAIKRKVHYHKLKHLSVMEFQGATVGQEEKLLIKTHFLSLWQHYQNKMHQEILSVISVESDVSSSFLLFPPAVQTDAC